MKKMLVVLSVLSVMTPPLTVSRIFDVSSTLIILKKSVDKNHQHPDLISFFFLSRHHLSRVAMSARLNQTMHTGHHLFYRPFSPPPRVVPGNDYRQ